MKIKFLFIGLAFLSGYVVKDVVDTIQFHVGSDAQFQLVSEANAKVDGMNYRELRRDRDFKKAVRYIVSNNCTVYDSNISC